MIPPLPGWTRRAHGDTIIVAPAGDASAAEIRYTERVRPLARVRDLIPLQPPPGFVAHASGAVEPFVTDEGEYAAQVASEGEVGGVPTWRHAAFVFVDDFYARIVGWTARPAQAGPLGAQVHALAVADSHMLGVRRRRFVYDAPAGWAGFLAPPYHAHWHPPGFPRDPASIVVFPALPLAPDDVLEQLAAATPGPRAALAGPDAVTTATHLSGSWWTAVGPALVSDFVVLADARYSYPLVLQSRQRDRPRHAATLLRVARSVAPIPQPGAGRAEATTTLWVE